MRNTFVVGIGLALLIGCGTLVGPDAPESCGFQDGAALSYAGRSTTAALEVQQVVGDAMSDDPADIYITRDKFDQGDLHGRLVCAIYIGQNFVEVTVHPADGGRMEPPDPIEPVPEPSDGISREEAVQVARNALPAGKWEIAVVKAGQLGLIDPAWESYDFAGDISAASWVWRVFLVRGDRGADVIIDYVDGSVYGVVESIVDRLAPAP